MFAFTKCTVSTSTAALLRLLHCTATQAIHTRALRDSAVETGEGTKHCFGEHIPAGLPVAGEAQYQVRLAPLPVTSIGKYLNKFSLWIPAEGKRSTKAQQSQSQR